MLKGNVGEPSTSSLDFGPPAPESVTSPGIAAAPPVKPAGLGSLDLTPEQNRVLPHAPEGYAPSALAPARHDYEDSVLYKIGSVLSSMGRDGVPVNLKMKMAQAQVDGQIQENQLAIANYYKSNEVTRVAMLKQNRDAALQFVSMIPNIKAQIASMDPKDVEGKQALLDTWKGLGESHYPGGAALVDHIAKNLSSVFGIDAFLSHPDPKVAGPFKELVGSMGYDNAIKSPAWLHLAQSAVFDWTNAVSGMVPKDMQVALGKRDGSVNEVDFRKELKNAALNPDNNIRPQQLQAIMAYLDEPAGQKYMANRGIETGDVSLAQMKKQKDMTAIQQGQDEDYKSKKAILEDAKANPNKYTPTYLKTVQDDVRVYLGTQAKATNPGENPNSPFNRAIDIKTGGRVKSLEDIALLPADEQPKYYKIAEQVQQEVAERAPLAGNTAKLSMLHDSNEKPVYKMVDGRVKRISTPMTEGQYRSMADGFTLTPAQKEHISKIDAAEIGGHQLFDQAAGAYHAKTGWQRMGEVGAERVFAMAPGIGVDELKAKMAESYPDLYAYVSRRDSVLGTYAKGLGGEAGVLTDQDIARVKQMFAGSADTEATRASKRKAFQQIIDLNRKAIANILTSNQGTENEGQVSPAQILAAKEQYKNQINGILGSVEDKVRRDQAALEGPKSKSLAEPTEKTQAPGEKKNYGESILDRMKKGKP